MSVSPRVVVTALIALGAVIGVTRAADRPNILWITSEDNSPYLGCYGDMQAQTPHLDRLAAEGVRYRHAFANVPVCSPARSTLITGRHAVTLGLENHRSVVAVPPEVRLYPSLLRDAGYYCTNNEKTDYNLGDQKSMWDRSGKDAHYRDRPAGRPFFAVYNLMISHELHVSPPKDKTVFRVAPADVKLPPYHPDVPELRREWANYFDRMTEMDRQAGALLDQLQADGLAEDTIVFYFSDHGGALPGGKRNLSDAGTRVPLIVRIPEKWRNWSPAAPGGWDERLVDFTDIPATVLALGGAPVPPDYAGIPFLGPRSGAGRDHVFLYRGRMDERFDTVRGIRARDFLYLKNFSPQKPLGQHYHFPFAAQPGMGAWWRAFREGRCDPVQSAYWQPRPAEELYDTAQDPFCTRNLVGDAEHAGRLASLREALRGEVLAARDVGFIPEGLRPRLLGPDGVTLVEYASSDERYPLARVLTLADLATSREVGTLPELRAALKDPHPVMRYWAATGCLVLGAGAAEAVGDLRSALTDEVADVRVVAAEALVRLGERSPSLETLGAVVAEGNPAECLAALNALDALREAGLVDAATLLRFAPNSKYPDNQERIVRLWRR